MDHASASFAASSPWAAVLGGHHSMGGTTNSEHGFGHHGLPMDLHVPQGYSYYRWILTNEFFYKNISNKKMCDFF